jgi:hypothetical protein
LLAVLAVVKISAVVVVLAVIALARRLLLALHLP